MKIGLKLIIGFLVVALIAVVVGGVGIFGLGGSLARTMICMRTKRFPSPASRP